MTEIGEIRWSEPIRSWVGILVGALIALPAIGRLVSGAGVPVVNLLMLVAGLVLLVPSLLARVVAGSEGIEVWPFRTRLAWDNLEWFEASGTIVGAVRAHQHGLARPTTLTVQPIRPGRARDVVDRLNDELDAAKRTS